MELANLKSAIKKLEAINPLNEYAYENALLTFSSIKQLPLFIHEIPGGLKICRTRTHETFKLFKTISEISNPPNKFVQEFARCNRPFQSKFYAGESRPTSYVELIENWAESNHSKEKLFVTTGLWVTKNSLQSIIITTPDIENRSSDYDKYHGQALDNFIGKYDGEFKEGMILFYRFLFEKFRKPAKYDPLTYIITTAYCNLALAEAKGKVNCILYPSVPFEGRGINVAINSDFINPDNIELQNIMCNEMKIFKIKNNKLSFIESNDWIAKEILTDSNEIIW